MEEEVYMLTRIRVSRPLYTQTRFDKDFEVHARHNKSPKERVQDYKKRCTCRGVLYKIFPFLKNLRDYSVKEDLVSDLISGLTVGVMHIPHGMAYGMLANLSPVYGLYASFFPTLIYFFFGTSKHISLGTFAVTSLMTGIIVDNAGCDDVERSTPSLTTTETSTDVVTSTWPTTADYYSNSTESLGSTATSAGYVSDDVMQCRVQVAAMVAFIVGMFQLSVGLFRMGWVTIYLSEPITRSFTTAAAVYVFTSQMRHLLGISVPKYSGPLNLVYTWIDIFKNITAVNFASLILGIIVIVTIYLVKEYVNPKVKANIKMPVPIELIWVILGTVISLLIDLDDRFHVKVVGEIPEGLPYPTVPPMNRFATLYKEAIGLMVVASANNFAMAKLFARKQSYNLDSNTEFLAYGLSHMVSSFFSCFATSASLSRSLVQENVGGKTQIAGLVSCVFLLVILFGVGPLFEQLPRTVLAGIVIVNLKGMFMQFKDLKKLWKVSKYDFTIWLVMFWAVTLLDVDTGLFVGVIFAMFTVIFRTQSPYTCLLGRVPHTDIYKDVSVYAGSKEVPGIKIYRFESSLYYANSDHFLSKLFLKTGVNPIKLRAAQVKWEKKQEWERKKREAELKKRNVEASAPQENCEPTEATPANGEAIPAILPSEELTIETEQGPRSPIAFIVIDCCPMSYLDAPGISTLAQAVEEYDKVKVTVFLAGCKAGVREQLQTAGFFDNIPESRLYLSVHDAVLAAFQSEMAQAPQFPVEEGQTSPAINYHSVFELRPLLPRRQLSAVSNTS